MPRRFEIGPVGYAKSVGDAGLNFTPLSDRSALVTAIRITKPSASDDWQLSVASKEITRFHVDADGHQQLTSAPSASSPANRDFFVWAEHVIGKPVAYPVPNGQVLSVASVGGATADIAIEFEEHDKGDMSSPSLLNHYEGKHFRLPVWANAATAIAAAGEVAYDTQVSPTFVPKIFTGTQIQAGYEVDIHALWLEGGGDNDYGDSDDDQIVTDHVWAIVNSQRLFTRVPYTQTDADIVSQDGIPLVGTASASGSANQVFGCDLERFPAFQIFREPNAPIINPAIHLGPGTTSTWGISTSGAYETTHDMSDYYLVALCDVTVL